MSVHTEVEDEQARLQAFARAIDAIGARVEAELGPDDVAHVRRVRRASTALEVLGRGLLHVSLDPVTFLAGTLALAAHKQLETAEIGHPALHGAWDGLPGAEAFASPTFRWRTPIDEPSWRLAHNLRHHPYTNVGGRDPDIHFGPVRLTPLTPHRRFHYLQVPWVLWESQFFLFGIHVHVTGVVDAVFGNGRPEGLDLLPDRSPASVRGAFRRMLRKSVPHLLREYVLFPALAGPLFLKVLAGNWLSGALSSVFSAALIYCGHVGREVQAFPDGTRARSRGAWYRMQVEGSQDFEVPRALALLCGGLERQIEHHLFPRLPPARLRALGDEVRRACEAHGVAYRRDTWPRALGGVLARLWALSFPPSAAPEPVARGAPAYLEA